MAATPLDTGVLPPDAKVETFHDLCLFLRGDVTSFTGDLLRLIGKADLENGGRLAIAFPRHVIAWKLWNTPGTSWTAQQLAEAIDVTAVLSTAILRQLR